MGHGAAGEMSSCVEAGPSAGALPSAEASTGGLRSRDATEDRSSRHHLRSDFLAAHRRGYMAGPWTNRPLKERL